MNRWIWPLAVFSLGSLGALAMSDRRRDGLRWLGEQVSEPEMLDEWNDVAQRELERIRMTLNQLAESLAAAR